MAEDRDYYCETLARMERDIATVDNGAANASIAISLRRIADSLERITTTAGLMTLISEIKPLVEALDQQ